MSPDRRASTGCDPISSDEKPRQAIELNPGLLVEIQEHLQIAELETEFTNAHTELSIAHSWVYFNGYDPAEERQSRQDRAKAAVERAQKLEPDLPEVHLALGYYYYWVDRDYDQAIKELSIAAEGLPNNPRIFLGIGLIQRRLGKLDECMASLEKAVELDPQNARDAFTFALDFDDRHFRRKKQSDLRLRPCFRAPNPQLTYIVVLPTDETDAQASTTSARTECYFQY